ncbi:fibronectin type III domain-containing protein [Desulfurivibrio sp. D14AmB]|uniref:fibronectin type III domain-containing protein n=1 Tax=Desulfurivibrio sp. D14AmB TaxID=3374370 RepID=UPI00376EE661
MKLWHNLICCCLALIISLAFGGLAQAKQEPDGGLLAVSDGRGEVRLFWFPPLGQWPEGGWRLTGEDQTVLVERIVPLAETTLAVLSRDEIEEIRELVANLPGPTDAEGRDLLYAILGLNAMSSFERAQALGLGWVLRDVPGGLKSYRVTGLTGEGAAGRTVLSSPPVDSRVASPLPAPPAQLRGQVEPDGVALFWQPPPQDPLVPVIAYHLERFDGGRIPAPLPESTLILGLEWDLENPTHRDPLVPVEQEVTYQVASLDLFGRRSQPAATSFFVPDLAALKPPSEITAHPEAERVVINWRPDGTPNTAGYIVERSTSYDGLYSNLTPQGLKPDSKRFIDTTVIGGVNYHYRLRAVGPRGNLGEPSAPAIAAPLNRRPPPAPGKVTAAVNPIQVILRWEAAQYPVAGYLVEKRERESDRWSRLNARIISEREYRDQLSPETHGTFLYRVIAVAYDNQLSPPSREVVVEVEDLSPPPSPRVTGLDGSDGQVIITFEPGPPEQKTAGFTLLRGLESRQEGVVIKENLPAQARRYVDNEVKPGQGYWYALVAVDARQRPSQASQRLLVMVAPPEIPTPAKPRAKALTTPFTHVEITFKAPPKPFTVALQRQESSDAPWLTISSGVSGSGRLVDANPPQHRSSRYRLVWQTENGSEGNPSEPVEVRW